MRQESVAILDVVVAKVSLFSSGGCCSASDLLGKGRSLVVQHYSTGEVFFLFFWQAGWDMKVR